MNSDKEDYSRYMPGNPASAPGLDSANPSSGNRLDSPATSPDAEDALPPADSVPAPVSDDSSLTAGAGRPRLEHLPGAGELAVDHICQALSWILVPLLMPVYGIMLIFAFSTLSVLPFEVKFSFTVVTFLINCALPMVLVLLLKKMGLVQDIGLNGRKERLIPYIISILALGGTALFFLYKQAPEWIWLFFIGGAAGGLINMAINFRWKISAHAAGIAGVVAVMTEMCSRYLPETPLTVWTLVTIALAGLLGSARIWMGRHTTAQVFAGYAVGFLSVYLLSLIAR